ncbi:MULTISPECIES: Do family serine endopeptidase [unclassified Saccharibacter]|uniref:Do family serine endopeptidase n=1 Tax=unclassified Saccharibacter TaxID=2648722 RepID=UPI00132C376F|nr:MULTISPECIES: Do family serine endopeptidase [unclassified Saccharibacter]MXV35135.1 Do family serine endopeptidase [Saccharibacter sp. EH611]MXV57318.1 Do family serine endopeptidase [Saccharibacter sp. EH70]MXV64821.1 Do family serine endopeptidase [Saccharibacter sp. EH60]
MSRFIHRSVPFRAALLAALSLAPLHAFAEEKPAPPPTKATLPALKEGIALPSFADLTDRLLPAVVNISVSSVIRPQQDGSDGPDTSNPNGPQTPPYPQGSPLDKFFHDYMKHKHQDGAPERQVQALGSGFIIDPSGVVVTNNHVIDKAQQVTVVLNDGTEMPAKIVGRDSQVDLAVLQVKPAHPLPSVPLGHSDQARIGEWVLAIGNPFGLSGTVTAGIISSRKRNVEHGLYDDFIQTDAAINRGNSGGPLFNTRGEVIGINTLIYGGAGGDSIGIGFAIPSDDARGLIEQLRRNGYVNRGWMGVSFQDVTRTMADDLDFHADDGQPGKGAILSTVKAGGPAARSGLAVGDIVTAIDGQAITGQTMPRLVAAHEPGTSITLDVWHRGSRKQVALTLGKSPNAPDPLPSDTHPPAHPTKTVGNIGLKVSVIDADARTQYQLSDSQRGVLVTRVFDSGTAAARGIAEGNVITQVGESEVNSPDAFQAALERAREMKKSEVLLLVQDNDGMRWVPLPLEAR